MTVGVAAVVVVAGAAAVRAGVADVVLAATGACAKEATATPDNTVAAIRVLIFNMVQYSLNNDSRISSDHLERPGLLTGLAHTTPVFDLLLTTFTIIYRGQTPGYSTEWADMPLAKD